MTYQEGDDDHAFSGEQIVPPDVMAWMEGATPRTEVKDTEGEIWDVTSVRNDVIEQTDLRDVMSERDVDTPLDLDINSK